MQPRDVVRTWCEGRAADQGGALALTPRASALAERCRRAYRWIVERAVLCPYTDVEFGTPLSLGQGGTKVELARATGYSSYVLLPLLTLMTGRRLLLVGAPGRGKTTVAVMMGLLAGLSPSEMRRAVQHGHPQLTITDLLGSPLPSQLIRAEEAGQVKVAWRRWLTLPVKVIDEYNRIPTKTQSALLSLMAEGYAEMFEQVIECGRSAWFLTANDDQGGGTFQVIEALKDRIDVVVRTTPFHAQQVPALAARVRDGRAPDDFVPADVTFSAADLAAADQQIRAVAMPPEALGALGAFLGQLDFCRRASDRLEFQNKDTLHLAGKRVATVCTEDCPLDKQVHLCTQTESGVSARAYQTLIHFAQALAWFRGHDAVAVEDLRQLAPWVLHEKLAINAASPFFLRAENSVLLTDRVSWIRQLFDRALALHAARAELRAPVVALERAAADGGGLSVEELRRRLAAVEQGIEAVLAGQELDAAVHEDLVRLKRIHVRYQGWLDEAEAR